MKKTFIALMFIWVTIWQPSLRMEGQATKPTKNLVDQKEKEKLQLFQKVALTQDSILAILREQTIRKPSAVKYIKVYRAMPVDTLKVNKNVIVNPPDELPDNYYLIPDTAFEKKKKPNIFQRLFHRKSN